MTCMRTSKGKNGGKCRAAYSLTIELEVRNR
jgi:hypothetical protein